MLIRFLLGMGRAGMGWSRIYVNFYQPEPQPHKNDAAL
jgi:hypothetical protein